MDPAAAKEGLVVVVITEQTNVKWCRENMSAILKLQFRYVYIAPLPDLTCFVHHMFFMG